MASDIPVKDLRRIRDWHADLGLVRVTAELRDGTLVAWWQHPTTGEYHEIPRAYWEQEGTVKSAVAGCGWPLGGSWRFFSEPFLNAAIYAARRGPSVTPTATEASQPPLPEQRRTAPGWAQKSVIGKLREKYPPDGIPPEGTSLSEACREIGEDPERRWHTVDRTVKRLKEAKRLRG
jgi:hypothetical protein